MKTYIACLLLALSGHILAIPVDSIKEDQTHFSMRYLIGRGVPRDATYAFHQLLEAANHNDPLAQNEIAYLYLSGKGCVQSAEKAFEYYQKAAKHNLASAQYNLGLLYQYGVGHAPDAALACTWLTQAAALGFEPAKQAFTRYCHVSSSS